MGLPDAALNIDLNGRGFLCKNFCLCGFAGGGVLFYVLDLPVSYFILVWCCLKRRLGIPLIAGDFVCENLFWPVCFLPEGALRIA